MQFCLLTRSVILGTAALFLVTANQVHGAVLSITPGTTQQFLLTSNSNPSLSDLETIIGLPAGTLVANGGYKSNVGGPEEQQFASSYDTVFTNTPSDPADATITYVGGPILSSTHLYLVVKDGNATPPGYIINLNQLDLDGNGSFETAWNGTDTLQLTGFWPDQGAISHVEIVRGALTQQQTPPLPEPTSLAIWALGMVAAGFGARRMRKRK